MPKKKNYTRVCYVIEYEISNRGEGKIDSSLNNIPNKYVAKNYLKMSSKRADTKS